MTARVVATAALAVACALGDRVHAHFQLLYTENAALERGQATELVLLFTHPAHGGPNMDMGVPEAFYVVSQAGDEAPPTKTDLKQYLQPVSWGGGTGATSQGYLARLPNALTRSLGDYVFVLQPAPFYEKGEDKYIQQFTKMMMNIGGVPGNWADPVGLPAEILPLDKPYANWTGGVFRGIVMADGKPVPNAKIEVEYVNHLPDRAARRLAEAPAVVFPQGAFGTMSIRANDRGEFSIGLPRAGWWGICALDIGPDDDHEGKPLSQDAVLWVHARDMR